MNPLIAIILMAVFTYLVRALPMLLINKPIESIFIKSVLHYIPYAILTSMTVPYIFYASESPISAMIGTFVAITLAWLNKNLITVSVFAVISAYIAEIVLLNINLI